MEWRPGEFLMTKGCNKILIKKPNSKALQGQSDEAQGGSNVGLGAQQEVSYAKLWLNSKPKVEVCIPLGKVTLSMLWLNSSLGSEKV